MSKQTEPGSAFAPASGYASPCGRVTLYLGDCLALRHKIPADAAIISDPPYGMKLNPHYQRGKNGNGKKGHTRNHGKKVIGDEKPFDPTTWLAWGKVVLFGSNHFGARLPVGTKLIWLKRYDEGFGSFLSDAEEAWMKGGHGIYCRRDVSMQGESSNKMHPCQKPIGLMEWCMEKAKVPPGATVCDPYMGSGTTGIACIRTGRKFIGIEKSPAHFATAVERIKRELAQGDLFEMHNEVAHPRGEQKGQR